MRKQDRILVTLDKQRLDDGVQAAVYALDGGTWLFDNDKENAKPSLIWRKYL